MAIALTTMTGADGVRSSRAVINGNFSTVSNSMNKILTVIDTTTGKIDNTTLGSNNTIKTKAIELTEGDVGINLGNAVISVGHVQLNGATAQVQYGSNVFTGKQTINATSDYDYLTVGGSGISHPVLVAADVADIEANGGTSLPIGYMIFETGGTGGTVAVPRYYNGTEFMTITAT